MRGSVSVTRYYRTLSTFAGPFGIGTHHNYGYRLDTLNPQNAEIINLVTPDGNRFPFSKEPLFIALGTTTPQAANELKNFTVPAMQGAVITVLPGEVQLRWKDGTIYRFVQPTAQIFPQLESITDPNGNKITLTRNPNSPLQITQITDPVGRSLNLTYDGNNRIISIRDPIGRTVQYTYNSQGTLDRVTDPEGGITRFEYDAQNRLTKQTDARGVLIAQNSYDSNGRVIQQIQADGGVTTFEYTLLNPTTPASPVFATTVADPLGRKTTYRFSPLRFVLDFRTHDDQVRIIARAPAVNQIEAITGSANCMSLSCGASASAGDQRFKYDANGNVIEQKNALGQITTYSYDPIFNKVTSIKDPLGNTTSLAYDSRSNLLTQTDANGKTTSYKYDSVGQLTETTDPLGNKTTFSYDAFGNLVSITDAVGNKTRFQYDAISRQIEARDALGRTSGTEYDKRGRVVKQTDPKNQVTQFAYDTEGNLLSVTDARNKKTTFTYDAMGRLKTRTTPLGKTDTRSYDFNGNLTTFTDRRGQTSSFVYDELNRLRSETYADGSRVGRLFDNVGRLAYVTETSGSSGGLQPAIFVPTFTFQYDLAGRLLSSKGPVGTVQYQRDGLGRPISRQVTGQPAVTYNYDPVGNLLAAAIPGASVSYIYDARNQPLTINRSNGVSTQHVYDPVGRLLSIVHAGGATTLHSLFYVNDAAGNRVSQQTSSAQSLITQAATATYDDGNRLIQRSNTTFAYDDNGNLISETGLNGTTTYTWDSRNRLVRIAAPDGQIIDLGYDSFGNLIRQTDSGPSLNRSQTFVLDEITNVAHHSNSDGTGFSVLTGQLVDSHLATVRSSGEVEYALTDSINSTLATVDELGAIRGRFFYEPFGQTTTTGSYPFQYTGRVPGSDSLYYYRARFYNPLAGRFISEDPASSFPGNSKYVYARNKPSDFTDSSGLEPEARFGLSTNLTLGLGSPFTLLSGFFVSGGTTIGFTTNGVFFVQFRINAGASVGAIAASTLEFNETVASTQLEPGITINPFGDSYFMQFSGVRIEGNGDLSYQNNLLTLGAGYLPIRGGSSQTVSLGARISDLIPLRMLLRLLTLCHSN